VPAEYGPGSKVRTTIGLPVHNGGELLQAALESLRAQTAGFRCIIGDNASTDQTSALALGVARQDPRFEYVRRERNIGAIANFTDLLLRAETEFFCWAAHDDVRSPDFVAECERALDADPIAALAIPRVVLLEESSGREVRVIDPPPVGPPRQRLRSLLRHMDAYPVYGLFRRENLSPIVDTWGGDIILLARVLLRAPFTSAKAEFRYTVTCPEVKGQEATLRVPDVSGLFRRLAAEVSRAPLSRRERLACHAELLKALVSPRLRWRSQLLVENRAAMRGAGRARRLARTLLHVLLRPTTLLGR
jgi:glycosyltransferase involved in cell wall biosynthesis